jgi:pseudouridine-5'-phosphate glycosidase
MRLPIQYTDEIKKALGKGKPVVALESTIISHGMPYPQNIENALALEEAIREEGAIPATIALLEGKIRIGLTREELELLGSSKEVVKASRRDLPVLIARGMHAGTTVASTMICASLAGISIFATGGIGGVHRGAERNFDISADLQELAKTDVAVVCAGAKAILDLPLTLEYLETHGVPVLGFGTEEFPAFYTRTSGLKCDYALDSPEEAARILDAKWSANLHGGAVIANPIPEAYSLDKQHIDGAIETALTEARTRGLSGKELTPFLLERISDITGGESLEANRHLALNNAHVGARIAVALAERS